VFCRGEHIGSPVILIWLKYLVSVSRLVWNH
jgi:hypothetical protein